jgi:ABC-2 type transport system permease protein
MNILLRELKSNRRSLIIWGSALALLSFLMMAIYPSFADEAAKMEELFSLYPEGFMKAFGMDRLSLADAMGWFALEAYLMTMLFGSMFAVILSSSMLAKEEEEKTIEFLLAKPVTRNHIVTSKLVAFIGYLLLFNIGIGVVSFIGFELFADEYSRMELVRLVVAPFLAHLSFASLGFFLSLFFTRKKSSYSVGIGLVLLVYFLNVMASLTEKVQFLRYASPFYYMDAADIIVDGGINPLHTLILLTVSALAIGATDLLYNRRDITI